MKTKKFNEFLNEAYTSTYDDDDLRNVLSYVLASMGEKEDKSIHKSAPVDTMRRLQVICKAWGRTLIDVIYEQLENKDMPSKYGLETYTNFVNDIFSSAAFDVVYNGAYEIIDELDWSKFEKHFRNGKVDTKQLITVSANMDNVTIFAWDDVNIKATINSDDYEGVIEAIKKIKKKIDFKKQEKEIEWSPDDEYDEN